MIITKFMTGEQVLTKVADRSIKCTIKDIQILEEYDYTAVVYVIESLDGSYCSTRFAHELSRIE